MEERRKKRKGGDRGMGCERDGDGWMERGERKRIRK